MNGSPILNLCEVGGFAEFEKTAFGKLLDRARVLPFSIPGGGDLDPLLSDGFAAYLFPLFKCGESPVLDFRLPSASDNSPAELGDSPPELFSVCPLFRSPPDRSFRVLFGRSFLAESFAAAF